MMTVPSQLFLAGDRTLQLQVTWAWQGAPATPPSPPVISLPAGPSQAGVSVPFITGILCCSVCGGAFTSKHLLASLPPLRPVNPDPCPAGTTLASPGSRAQAAPASSAQFPPPDCRANPLRARCGLRPESAVTPKPPIGSQRVQTDGGGGACRESVKGDDGMQDSPGPGTRALIRLSPPLLTRGPGCY